MQFASSKTPTLTPLGQRLLALSRAKLYSLDAPAGARDPTDGLRRGVLVREAIRSAWASLETPTAHSELTSWRAPALDVLTEEDEEEDEYAEDIAEERWLDDVLADVDEDEYDEEPSAEFTVGLPVYDEDEYEFEATESYTLSYAQASTCAHGTDVTVVAVCESEDGDDDMVEDWLEVNSAVHVYDELDFAEELEVAAEPMEVDSTSEVSSSPSVASDTSTSPSRDNDELLITPPSSSDSLPDFAYALAALSTYALPPADLLPRLETKPLPEVDDFSSPSPASRPHLSRRAPFALPNEDNDNDADDCECDCDKLGLVCDGDCPPPQLSDCDEEEDREECRTPPLQALDCSELEVASGLAALDWKAADRISKRFEGKFVKRLEAEGFSSLALGLRLNVSK